MQPLSGSGVESIGNQAAVELRDCVHAGAFGQVLTDQSVRVFVGSPLPRVMRVGEIEARAALSFDVLIVVKFRSVVSGDGMDAGRMFANEPGRSGCHRFHGAVRQLADQGVAGLPLYQGDDAVLASRTHDGIDLPVANLTTVVDGCWPFTDVPLARDASTAIVAAVPLATLLGRATQVGVEPSATFLVFPDVFVDCLVTDRQQAATFEMPGNLLRAPQVRQQAFDQAKVVRAETAVAARPRPPATRTSIGLAGTVGAIVALVTSDLARNGARVAPKLATDGCRAASLLSKRSQHISLTWGDLAISHDDDPLLAGKDSSPVSPITSTPPWGGACAVSI